MIIIGANTLYNNHLHFINNRFFLEPHNFNKFILQSKSLIYSCSIFNIIFIAIPILL